jgi:hypothetical protein
MSWRINLAFAFAFFLAVFALLAVIGAEEPAEGILLEKGKNEINLTKGIFASEIILLNPEVKAISYYDSFTETIIGYVNAFGGIGKDFHLEPGEVYEIAVDEQILLVLPDGVK